MLGRHFFKRYVKLVLIPLLVTSILIVCLISYVESQVALYQQESYLKSVRNVWDMPVTQTNSVRDALGSYAELGWCLQPGYYSRSEQLYIYKKSLFNFFSNICIMNNKIDSIKIYSKNPDVLKVWPFGLVEDIPLQGQWRKELEQLSGNDILWYIRPADSLQETPEFYAYCKLYSQDHTNSLGYVETHIKDDFLKEYVELLRQNRFHEANFYLLVDKKLIYCEENFSLPDKVWEETRIKGKELGSYGRFFFFKFMDETFGVQMLVLIPRNLFFAEYMVLIVFCCFLVICLCTFSLVFFMDISRLSKRIGDFSGYMQKMDGEEIGVYREDPEYLPKDSRKNRDEFCILVDSFNSMTERNNVLHKKVLTLELHNKDAKLAAMQAQIHPHFIYGTLETIRMMAIQNDDEEVEGIVCAFSKLMRYSLNHPSERSTLFRELEINRSYMEIQTVRYDERLIFYENVEKQLPDIYCPPFIIQPLLENALVHGVSASLDVCEIHLQILVDCGDYVILIKDNGNAVSKERIEQVDRALKAHTSLNLQQGEQNGFALLNISERLNLFYREQAEFRLYKSDEWTVSEIRVREEEWRRQVC